MADINEIEQALTGESGIFLVMVGAPGSGKSTLAKEISDKLGYQQVSSDAVREDIYGDAEIQGDPEEVFGIVHDRCRSMLPYSNVILDATNASQFSRRSALSATDIPGRVRTVAIRMDSDPWVCLDRNSQRDRTVPETVVRKMLRNLERKPVRKEEGFDFIFSSYDVSEYLASFSES